MMCAVCGGFHATANHMPNRVHDFDNGSETEKCTVKGCDGYHVIYDNSGRFPVYEIYHTPSTPHCLVCDKTDGDHLTEECPKRCTIEGCKGWHTTDNHWCFWCNQTGVTHLVTACPDMDCSDGWHTTANHPCFVCKQIGADHISSMCPKYTQSSLQIGITKKVP